MTPRLTLALSLGLALFAAADARGQRSPSATPPATEPVDERPHAPPVPWTETWQPKVVIPSDTDPKIDAFSGDGWAHYVYVNPAAAKRGQLLVFIAGTNGKGSGAKPFLATAADAGYDVVSLAYPSTIALAEFHDSDDPDGFQKGRENILYGGPPYETLKINTTNCLMNRLVKLLAYLDRTDPAGHWGQYLVPGQADPQQALRWEKVALAGQSQGGGHAALMALQHPVARVVMFGSPKDFNVHFDQPAKWFSIPSKTPLDRFFCFVHTDDINGCTYPEQLENYHALGLTPKYAVANVDHVPAPFGHTRLFTTTVHYPGPRVLAHTAPISRPVYKPVWQYMLTEPVDGEAGHG